MGLHENMEQQNESESTERREFFKKATALIVGGVAAAVPIVAGLPVLLDPLRRKAQRDDFIRVTALAALPSDGIPRKFAIIADSSDAWNKFPQVPIGAVYLRRTAETGIQAFN